MPASPMRVVQLAAILIGLTLLSGCFGRQGDNTVTGQAIGVEDLPTGMGRGYPTVDLAGLDPASAALRKGEPAPNFLMRLEDGRTVSLDSLRGRPVLLNFWATWCSPCRLEMPEIVAAAASHPDLVVIAVNAQEALDQVQPFVEEFAMPMPVALDQDGALQQLYQVRGLPTSIFIDRDGRVAAIWAGMLTADLLTERLDEIH